MYEYADIKAYKPDRNGTHLQIFIPGRDLEEAILKKRIKDCMVWLDDGRHISSDQRRKAYATIRDIADFTGYSPEEMKQRLKLEHIIRTGCKEFSLSDCTMDTAREFINTMLDLALEMGIPLKDFGSDRTDDIDHYLWACLKIGGVRYAGGTEKSTTQMQSVWEMTGQRWMIPTIRRFAYAESIIRKHTQSEWWNLRKGTEYTELSL